MRVPFFRPDLLQAEVDEVVATLRSGWLTAGPRTARFEAAFRDAVGSEHALAVNSCTAAMHLAVAALGLSPGDAVLVPSLTFAATAEVIRYQGAVPVLVDCEAETLHLDLGAAEKAICALRDGALPPLAGTPLRLVGVIPVHVGGLSLDLEAVRAFAARHGLWVVEDAAHAFPAAFRSAPEAAWQRCGENSADVSCFSFYANKTLTTGEGGMAVTDDAALAERMRVLSLHGLSRDPMARPWDYRIVAPGFKYNTTDVAAAIGLHQLARAEEMRRRREAIAHRYREGLADLVGIELPPFPRNRVHAWHLFALRLRLEVLRIDRDGFLDALAERGVETSVHWRPLHLHPYYQQTFGWRPEDLPVSSWLFPRLASLPLFPAMRDDEVDHVISSVRAVHGAQVR